MIRKAIKLYVIGVVGTYALGKFITRDVREIFNEEALVGISLKWPKFWGITLAEALRRVVAEVRDNPSKW